MDKLKPEEGSCRVVNVKDAISDPYFDESALFESEIRPALCRLTELCDDHNIPFLCCAGFSNRKEEGNGIFVTACIPGARTPFRIRIAADMLTDKSGKMADAFVTACAFFHAFDNDTSNSNKENSK